MWRGSEKEKFSPVSAFCRETGKLFDNRIAQHTRYFPSAAGKTGKPHEMQTQRRTRSDGDDRQRH